MNRLFAVCGPFAAVFLGGVVALFGGIGVVCSVIGLIFGPSYRVPDNVSGLLICLPLALIGIAAARWSGAQCSAFIRQLKGTGCLRCAVRAASAHDLQFKE